MNSANVQNYGDDPLSVRESNHYQDEYAQSFVEKWDDLIDWRGRRESEGEFFIEVLRDHGVKKVLDVATGTGFHSVQLLKAGFEVTSVDGSPTMLAKAFENARDQGYILRTIQADWRWLNRDVHDLYDAEYYATLRHKGILVLDQRNYDALLDKQVEPSHKFYYCGEDVTVEPEHVDDSLARFRYSFAEGETYQLNMFPLRKNYVQRLMKDFGFQKVTTFGDFQETYRDKEPDFFVHVAEKEYVPTESNDE